MGTNGLLELSILSRNDSCGLVTFAAVRSVIDDSFLSFSFWRRTIHKLLDHKIRHLRLSDYNEEGFSRIPTHASCFLFSRDRHEALLTF